MNKELIKRILSSLILFPIVVFFIVKGSFSFIFFILIALIITIYEWHKMTKNKNHYIPGLFFLLFSFYSVYQLRNINDDGYFFLLFIVIICVSTDIGGYIFGKIFKGPKLTKISPKKTYSGVIGGYLLSIILANFYITEGITEKQIIFSLQMFIFVLLVSTVSQLGDILISYFKRLSKIKDTGKIIPGHGGLLDRIDGMIFAFPFSYLAYLTSYFGIF